MTPIFIDNHFKYRGEQSLNLFKPNVEIPYSATSLNGKSKFTYYYLNHLWNPDCSIVEYYQFITSTDSTTCLNLDFAEYLINHILPVLGIDNIGEQIFGKQYQKQQKQFLQLVIDVYQQKIPKKVMEQKYQGLQCGKFKNSSSYDKLRAFITHQLTSKVKVIAKNKKKQQFQKVRLILRKNGMDLEESKRISRNYVVLFPELTGCFYTLQQMINLKDQKVILPSGFELAQELLKALRKFKQQFQVNYPALSPDSIMFDVVNRKVQLAKLPFVKYQLGIKQNLTRVQELREQPWNIKRKFYLTKQQLLNQQYYEEQVEDRTVMWQLLALIDYYEKKGHSLFAKIETKKNLIKTIECMKGIINEKSEAKYFGRFMCEIIMDHRHKQQWITQPKITFLELENWLLEKFKRKKKSHQIIKQFAETVDRIQKPANKYQVLTIKYVEILVKAYIYYQQKDLRIQSQCREELVKFLQNNPQMKKIVVVKRLANIFENNHFELEMSSNALIHQLVCVLKFNMQDQQTQEKSELNS